MQFSYALLLGLIQGLTEFFPISSSGHLALAQRFMKEFHQPGLLLDVMLHWGTLASLMVFFRRDLLAICKGIIPGARGESQPSRHLALMLAAATVPTGIIGYGLRDIATRAFQWPEAVAAFLVATGFLVIIGSVRKRDSSFEASEKERSQVTLADALIIGVSQGLAVFPGLSRSGVTIAVGLLRGLEATLAARFSFLLAIPAILGAGLVELQGLEEVPSGEYQFYFLGMAVAGLSGYGAIRAVIGCVKSGKFFLFGVYCIIVGVIFFVLA